MDIDRFIEERGIERTENVHEFVQKWKELLQGLDFFYNNPRSGYVPLGNLEGYGSTFLHDFKAAIIYFLEDNSLCLGQLGKCHRIIFSAFIAPVSLAGKTDFKIEAERMLNSINFNAVESRLRTHVDVKNDEDGIRTYLYGTENLAETLTRFISLSNELILRTPHWKERLEEFSRYFETASITDSMPVPALSTAAASLTWADLFLHLAMPPPVEKGKSTFLKMIISYDNYFRIRFKQAF